MPAADVMRCIPFARRVSGGSYDDEMYTICKVRVTKNLFQVFAADISTAIRYSTATLKVAAHCPGHNRPTDRESGLRLSQQEKGSDLHWQKP